MTDPWNANTDARNITKICGSIRSIITCSSDITGGCPDINGRIRNAAKMMTFGHHKGQGRVLDLSLLDEISC